LADLIKNANTLFDEPVPNVAETTPTFTFNSFSRPEFTQSTGTQPMDFTTPHLFTPTGFSFAPSPSDPPVEGRSPDMTQKTPTYSFGLHPDFPRSAKVETVDSPTSHFSTPAGFSFAPSPPDPHVEVRSPGVAQTTPTYDFGLRPDPQSVKAHTSHFSTPAGFSFAPSSSGPPVEGHSPDPAQTTAEMRRDPQDTDTGRRPGGCASRHSEVHARPLIFGLRP
jgi:hypothetical protein